MPHVPDRNEFRAIGGGEPVKPDVHNKIAYFGLLARVFDPDMVADFHVDPGTSFYSIQKNAEQSLERSVVDKALERAHDLDLVEEIESTARKRYEHGINNGSIDPAEVTLPKALRRGVATSATEIAVCLGTLHYFQNQRMMLSEDAVRQSVRVPIKQAMIHGLNQDALFRHYVEKRPFTGPEDIMYSPRSVRFDSNEGLRFTGKLALLPAQYQAMYDYFEAEPFEASGPEIGCPVTLYPKFITGIYNGMVRATVDSGLIRTN